MKRFLLLTFISFVSGTSAIQAQPSDKLKQVFLDAEYFFLYEDYEEALYSYNALYKRGFAENGNINYRIGQCYLNISGEKQKAIPYLEKAVNYASAKYSEGSFKEVNAPYDSWFFLGNAYRINNELDKAISAYTKYKELIGPKNAVGIRLADKEMEACNNARQAIKSPRFSKTESLGRPVCTSSKDFLPAVSGDESVIVYNSAQKLYDAIFFSKKVNNKWTPPVNISPEVQSDGNQFVSSVSYDGTLLFLRIEDNFEADLYVSKYENGRWTKSKSIGKSVNSKFYEGNCSVSKDGNTLYFSSNRSGGKGALDIYKSQKQSNGEWGPVESLGDSINTEFNEDAPFISEDGKKLFFVSQGHNTLGGYDIFYSLLTTDGKWTKPLNMGYPVNTTDDNDFYFPVLNGEVLYTNIYSKEGFGYDDIYKIWLNSDMVALNESKNNTNSADTIRETALKPAKEITREIPEEVIKILTDSQATPKIPENYILRTLFYEFNSAELSAITVKELDHLAMVMKNFSGLKITLTGNTDDKGSDEYNRALSERRARNARNYLISKGISSSRISVKGQGETNFIAINNNPDGSDNPDGRKLNRRVDIQLLNNKYDNIKVEPVEIPDSLKIK